jgi:diguanylate cyclase (GGDEF)-like protein/PAS domain S-box-containing protein
VSFRKLGELPLYIIVGEGTTRYLQHWRSDAALLGTLAAFLFFGSITLSFMLTRSWNRQNQATETLAEQEFKFRTVADYTYDWEYWLGLEGEFLYISPSCERITGYAAGEFIANPKLIYEIMVPEDRRLMEAHITNIREDDHGTLDFRIMTKQGEMRWIAHGCQAVFGPDGRYLGRRANNRDITERKLAEEQVRQLAYYDPLTGLPNRRLLLERLDHALVQAKRFSRSLAVMFLDLDNFKKINDSLGHEAGDLLLKEVATRLAAGIRSGDTVARQGGDEFIIVLSEIADPHDASLVAEKVLSQLAGVPVSLAGQDISISTSIGIAVYPIAGTDSTLELMKKADSAMYDAKHAGRNRYCFYGSI